MRKLIFNRLQPPPINLGAVFLLVIALSACTPSKSKKKKPVDIRKEFVSKHYNLLPMRNTEYGSIKFRYPEWFGKSYYHDAAFKDKALCLEISRLSIVFTVEEFTPADLYGSLFENLDLADTSLLANFHYAYFDRRSNSLEGSAQSSETEKIDKMPFPALISFVSDGPAEDAMMYAQASVEVDSKVYIFQFISSRAMMGYITDDFLRIVRSVRKR